MKNTKQGRKSESRDLCDIKEIQAKIWRKGEADTATLR